MQNERTLTSNDFKRKARKRLKGRWLKDTMVASLFILPLFMINLWVTSGDNFLDNFLLSMPLVIGNFFLTLPIAPLYFGWTRNRLKLVRGKRNVMKDLLFYYRADRFVPVLIVYLLASAKLIYLLFCSLFQVLLLTTAIHSMCIYI